MSVRLRVGVGELVACPVWILCEVCGPHRNEYCVASSCTLANTQAEEVFVPGSDSLPVFSLVRYHTGHKEVQVKNLCLAQCNAIAPSRSIT